MAVRSEALRRPKGRSEAKTTAKAKAGPRRPWVMSTAPHLISKEEAMAMFPRRKGNNISKDTKLQFRWQISYPSETAPFTHSSVCVCGTIV